MAVEALPKTLTSDVAQRLYVQRCDRVILLAQGFVAADGPPATVINNF